MCKKVVCSYAEKNISVLLKVKVISFKGSKDGRIRFSNKANRPPNGSVPLFPNVATNKTYYMEVKIQHRIENEDGPTHSFTLQLLNALHSVVVRCAFFVCLSVRPFFVGILVLVAIGRFIYSYNSYEFFISPK